MEPKRILLIRLDRIGDLVLTLPVDQAIKDYKADWWIPPGLSFITENSLPARSAREIRKQVSFKEFMSLLRELRREKYHAAVVFHAPWWISLLIWLARIPLRGGVRSQWHSFLFFNQAIRQKRSRAEHSELEYNFRLVEAILKPEAPFERQALKLAPTASIAPLTELGLQSQTYMVVHPGMAGSARNWPVDHYRQLIEILTAENQKLVITGTSADEIFLKDLREKIRDNGNVIWLDGKLNGTLLVTVLANARAIFAPSTGVLHLAASTGRPTIGFFSPVRVQHPRRWGPQGDKTSTLLPEISCPGTMGCLGETCASYDCMTLVKPADALRALNELGDQSNI